MYVAQFETIEKIKIIGSTFMAACGLKSGRKNSQDLDGDTEPISKETLNIQSNSIKMEKSMHFIFTKSVSGLLTSSPSS